MKPIEEDVRRVDFGYFVRPGAETDTGVLRVEPVLGYLVRRAERWLLFDTGMGGGYEDLDVHYRPVRRPLADTLALAGVSLDEVAWVANCHLHFDHCGGNPELVGRPVFAQEIELQTARESSDYTLPELVAESIAYEVIRGESEMSARGVSRADPGPCAGSSITDRAARRWDGDLCRAVPRHGLSLYLRCTRPPRPRRRCW